MRLKHPLGYHLMCDNCIHLPLEHMGNELTKRIFAWQESRLTPVSMFRSNLLFKTKRQTIRYVVLIFPGHIDVFCPVSHLSLSRVTHIFVSKLSIVISYNGKSPGWHQAIIWTNHGISFTGLLGTNFNEILSATYKFSFKKIQNVVWKMVSILSRPQCVKGERCTPVMQYIITPCAAQTIYCATTYMQHPHQPPSSHCSTLFAARLSYKLHVG